MLGLDKLGNLGDLMRGAKELQEKMAEAQDSLAGMTVVGESGGGMVRVTVHGANEILAMDIDPDISTDGDREMLQDLMVAATNTALAKARELAQTELGGMLGGVLPPGLMGSIPNVGG